MALIKSASHQEFDLDQIRRGDCIQVRRSGEPAVRNGFVTEVTADLMRVLYCNIQNNATSYLEIRAADVGIGMWEIRWTQDFQTVNHEPGRGA